MLIVDINTIKDFAEAVCEHSEHTVSVCRMAEPLGVKVLTIFDKNLKMS